MFDCALTNEMREVGFSNMAVAGRGRDGRAKSIVAAVEGGEAVGAPRC
jgi:hypothetical protein